MVDTCYVPQVGLVDCSDLRADSVYVSRSTSRVSATACFAEESVNSAGGACRPYLAVLWIIWVL